jgi:hypothetical protein
VYKSAQRTAAGIRVLPVPGMKLEEGMGGFTTERVAERAPADNQNQEDRRTPPA